MFFEENYQRFKSIFPDLIPYLDKFRNKQELEKTKLIATRTEYPTLEIEMNNQTLFLHSKFNPVQEAEVIMKKYLKEIEKHDHLFFYGVGLGYHIEHIMNEFPEKTFTIFEPNPYIFIRFLESRPLEKFPFNQIRFLHFNNVHIKLNDFLLSFYSLIKDYQLVTLPSYERIFQVDLSEFEKSLVEVIKINRDSMMTEKIYSKRWLLNSLMNLRTTIQVPNIIESKKAVFKNKPIIIAAAGPSLYDDIELIRHIKEKRLAYIFAVGSANKALLKHGIVPDAVVTYDPQPHNVGVFRELINSGRMDIPMIYGTSVGFETIEEFQGPKFHMVTSVDNVTSFYLDKAEKTPDVFDSMTISLIAIQLAQKLEASLIILAGQNLAFKENRYYAEGIKFADWEGEIREKEYKDIFTVKDVEGNLIETNNSLNNMRLSIEYYLRQLIKIPIINTTKKGAAIEGAPYVPLEELIALTLTSAVVETNWWEYNHDVKVENIYLNIQKLENSINKMYKNFRNVFSLLDKMKAQKQEKDTKKIEQLFIKFDNEFDQFLSTECYLVILKPLLKNNYEILEKKITGSYYEKNIEEKLDIIIQAYNQFFLTAKTVFEEMNIHIKNVIHPTLRKQLKSSWKRYKFDDGCFLYNGKWETKTLQFIDVSTWIKKSLERNIWISSTEKGNSISFKFIGSNLRIIASVHALSSSKIQIQIDGKKSKFTTQSTDVDKRFSPNIQQVVFEIEKLPNQMHEVIIELSRNELFAFEGIEINKAGRIYHLNEVETVEELEIGKRIRCHYIASYNNVGSFSGLGEEIGEFLPMEPTSKPNGDFYFIMDDEEIGGCIKLVADRSIQQNISWEKLNNSGVATEQGRKELFNLVPDLINYTGYNGRAIESAYYTGVVHYQAWKAFNRTHISNWRNRWSVEGVNQWIGYTFNEPTIVNAYSLITWNSINNWKSAMPKKWRFEASNDNINWITLEEVDGQTDWRERKRKVFTFENEEFYRSYRIYIIENNGDQRWTAIFELEFGNLSNKVFHTKLFNGHSSKKFDTEKGFQPQLVIKKR